MKRTLFATTVFALVGACVMMAVTRASANEKKPVRIAYVGFAADNTFTIASLNGMKAAAKEEGGNITIDFFDGAFDPNKQFNEVEDAVAAHRYDVIAISPMGYQSIVPAEKEAIAAGIKFGALEYPLGPDPTISTRFQVKGQTTFVGYNIRKIGVAVGNATVDACARFNPCNVVFLVGSREAAQELPKMKAFDEVMRKHPSIHVVATGDMGWDRAKGLAVMQDILQAHSNVNVVTCLADQASVGVELALKGAGLKVGGTDGVQIIGLGATKTALAAIRAGRWYGTFVELPWEEGYLTAKNLIRAARGEKYTPIIDLETLSPVGAPVATKKLLDEHPKFVGRWDG
jgi:ribose transport system substrate-binding protein